MLMHYIIAIDLRSKFCFLQITIFAVYVFNLKKRKFVYFFVQFYANDTSKLTKRKETIHFCFRTSTSLKS